MTQKTVFSSYPNLEGMRMQAPIELSASIPDSLILDMLQSAQPASLPKPLSSEQLKAWEAEFEHTFAALVKNDPRKSNFCIPDTPFSVWLFQDMFVLSSLLIPESSASIRFFTDFSAFLRTASQKISAPNQNSEMCAKMLIASQETFKGSLKELERQICRLKFNLPRKRQALDQLKKLINISRLLMKRNDSEVINNFWFKNTTAFIKDFNFSTFFDAAECKVSLNETLEAFKRYAKGFVSNQTAAAEMVADLEKKLASENVITGKCAELETEMVLSNHLNFLASAFHNQNTSKETGSLLSHVPYHLKSFLVTICNQHRLLLINEVVQNKCCGHNEQKAIAYLMDALFERLELIEETFEEFSICKMVQPEAWQFFAQLHTNIQNTKPLVHKSDVDFFKKQPISVDSLQKLFFFLYELEESVGVYFKQLEALPAYQQYAEISVVDDFDYENPIHNILQVIPRLAAEIRATIANTWVHSLGKLPTADEKRAQANQAAREAMLRFMGCKDDSEEVVKETLKTEENTSASLKVTTEAQKARNKKKKAKRKAKQQQLKAEGSAKVIMEKEANEVPEPLEPMPNEAVVEKRAEESVSSSKPNVESKKARRRRRQEKKAEKEAALTPTELMPKHNVKFRELFKNLLSEGWSKVKQTGSHCIMKHSLMPGTLSVPNHPTLAHGTVEAIVKKKMVYQQNSSSKK